MQTISRRQFSACLMAVAVAAVSATCSESLPPAEGGTTQTFLTDSPFPYDRVERVDIHVMTVSASLGTDTSASSPETFHVLASPNRTINLLALQNGVTDELGSVDLPAGTIKSVRLTIDTDKSSMTLKDGRVLTGSSSPGIAWQSSAGKPVLNALIHDQIEVSSSGAQVIIDFDVGQAFIPPSVITPGSTDEGFIFSPVIRAAEAGRSGSISGTVRAKAASGAPVPAASLRLYLGKPNNPENTWSTLASARSDANGAFKFAYIPRSGFFADSGVTYIVAVDPPSGSGLGRQLIMNVTATAGQETKIGVVILP
jgi:hypothetical protein